MSKSRDLNDMAGEITLDEIIENSKPYDGKKESKINDLAYNLSDQLLREKYKGGEYLILTSGGGYWRYTGTHWELFDKTLLDNVILNKIIKHKRKYPKNNSMVSPLIGAVERITRAMVARDIDFFRVKSGVRSIINCKNGEVRIDDKTGVSEFMEHDPRSYLHSCLGVDFNRNAKCSLWVQTLREIFNNHLDPGGTIGYLQEIFGYTLQSNKNIATWVLFKGDGNNGKSLVLNILGRVLSDAALEKSIGDLDTGKNKHALADLPGKLAIIDDDVKSKTVLPDGIMKKVSENKMLNADPKNCGTYKFKNTAIIFLASNSWPVSRDLSNGMNRRANVIVFDRNFRESEVDCDRESDIARNELDGVLSWALEGLIRLRKRGKFAAPMDCIAAKKEWLENSSQLQQFLSATCELNPNDGNPVDDLWDWYWIWAIDQKIKQTFNKTGFHRSMKEAGYKIEDKQKDGLFGIMTPHYIGVKHVLDTRRY